MKTLDKTPPVNTSDQTHTQRQFLRWSKCWLVCKEPKRKEMLLRQMVKLGEMVERELLSRQRD